MKTLAKGDKIVLEVKHETRFSYSDFVSQSHNELRMSPPETGLQRVLQRKISVDPAVSMREHRDHFGNHVVRFNLLEPHNSLTIVSHAIVETTSGFNCGFESAQDPRPYLERWVEFLDWSTGVPHIEEYGQVPFPQELSMAQDEESFSTSLLKIADYFYRTFNYDADVTNVYSSPRELFVNGGGVCQDMAHAMIGVLRRAGIPARYVSGYIYDERYAGTDNSSVRGSGATHAWVQAWHDRSGWIGIDPTNNKLVNWQYVRTAVGRDYFDVQPIRGVFQGSPEQQMSVSVAVGIVDTPA